MKKLVYSLMVLSLAACGSSGQQGEPGAAGAKGDSCFVVTNADGTATIKCTDGSSYDLKNNHDNQTAKICRDGFYGADCDQACPAKNGLYCMGLGVCNDGITGKGCVCDVDWLNTDCSFIKPDFGSVTFDSDTYKTIKIGSQIWLAENLRIIPQDGTLGTNYFNPNNDENNVATDGYLYTWDTAQNICPDGWRLPSAEDFQKLLDIAKFAGRSYSVFISLIAKSSNWTDFNNIGLDEFGFGGLPAGGYNSGKYFSFGSYGGWWSSTVIKSYIANCLLLGDGHADVSDYDTLYGLSVRCLKDEG